MDIDNGKYDKRIVVKVTSLRIAKLSNFATENRMTKSESMRLFMDYFLDKQDESKIIQKDLQFKSDLICGVRRLGNNLNQIAHKLNIALKNENLTAGDRSDVKHAVTKISKLQDDYYDFVSMYDKRL